jgi:hypothetical protein
MEKRAFLRVLGGGVITAAGLTTVGCSSELPDEALAAWRGPGSEPMADADPRRWLLGHAILAPHSHNLQSWLVDLREPDGITLYCDLTRLLPETDPFSRQMMMSQGTFLEALDLAAGAIGLRTEIVLFPKGAPGADKLNEAPTAHIRLIRSTDAKKDALFDALFKRRTNRNAYEAKQPSAQALAAIRSAVQQHPSGQDITLAWIGAEQPQLLEQHREIAMTAWKVELETPRTILESYHWIRVGPSEIAQHRDGISINSPMVRALAGLGLFDRSKAPAPGDSAISGQIKDFNAKIAATPMFFTMVSANNQRATQVQAGRAYMRAQLAATANGLSMQPLSQALQEYPEQASSYRRIHALSGATAPGQTVQMWTRLGYAADIAPAPRRGVQAHIKNA